MQRQLPRGNASTQYMLQDGLLLTSQNLLRKIELPKPLSNMFQRESLHDSHVCPQSPGAIPPSQHLSCKNLCLPFLAVGRSLYAHPAVLDGPPDAKWPLSWPFMQTLSVTRTTFGLLLSPSNLQDAGVTASVGKVLLQYALPAIAFLLSFWGLKKGVSTCLVHLTGKQRVQDDSELANDSFVPRQDSPLFQHAGAYFGYTPLTRD